MKLFLSDLYLDNMQYDANLVILMYCRTFQQDSLIKSNFVYNTVCFHKIA